MRKCMYQVSDAEKARLVGSRGKGVGSLEVGADGKVRGIEVLKGSWIGSESGRNTDGDASRRIECL